MKPKAFQQYIRFALGLAALLSARVALAQDDEYSHSGRGLKIGPEEDESDPSPNVTVDVVVDMTDAGRKIVRPTPANPAYYMPLPFGYHDIGWSPSFQRTRPTSSEVSALVEKEMTKQGYLLMTHEHQPSLVFTYRWGYIDPGFDAFPGPINSLNNKLSMVPPGEMEEMLFGDNYHVEENKVRTNLMQEDFRLGATDVEAVKHGHWYILIVAYDFDSWLKNIKEAKSGKTPVDKPILLWKAHITTPIWGRYYDQVVQTLITTAGPLLGRETGPQYFSAPVQPIARVIVGAPVVKDFPAAPAAPALGPKP